METSHLLSLFRTTYVWRGSRSLRSYSVKCCVPCQQVPLPPCLFLRKKEHPMSLLCVWPFSLSSIFLVKNRGGGEESFVPRRDHPLPLLLGGTEALPATPKWGYGGEGGGTGRIIDSARLWPSIPAPQLRTFVAAIRLSCGFFAYCCWWGTKKNLHRWHQLPLTTKKINKHRLYCPPHALSSRATNEL